MIRSSILLRQREVAVLAFTTLVTFLGLGVVMPVWSLYAQSLHAPLIVIGAMTASYLAASFILQPVAGWLSDRHGRTRLIVMGIGAHAVIGVLYLVFANPLALVGLRCLEGAAAALVIPATRAYVADIVQPEERGEAYGIMSSVMGASLFLGPAVGGFALAALGFAAPFLISAGTAALGLVLVVLLLKEPSRHVPLAGESVGSVDHHGARALRFPPLLGLFAITLGANWAYGLFDSLWSIWLRHLGASFTFIGVTYTVFALPLMLLPFVTGRLADRLPRRPLILLPALGLALIFAMYGLMRNFGGIVVLGVMEGALTSLLIPAADACVADWSPNDARGQIQGLYLGAGTLGGVLGSLTSAWLFGVKRDAPFLVSGLVMLIAVITAAVLMNRRTATVDLPTVEPWLGLKS